MRDLVAMTPLWNEWVATRYSYEVMKVLMKKEKKSFSLLFYVAFKNKGSQKMKILKYLLKTAADPNPVDRANSVYRSLQHQCVEVGTADVLGVLVEYSPLKNPRNEHGEAPLHMAAKKNIAVMVQTLLEKGAG